MIIFKELLISYSIGVLLTLMGSFFIGLPYSLKAFKDKAAITFFFIMIPIGFGALPGTLVWYVLFENK